MKVRTQPAAVANARAGRLPRAPRQAAHRPAGQPRRVATVALPAGALTAIGHRVSGVVLAASVPAAVWLLDLSLRDEPGYARATGLFDSAAVRVIATLVLWALAHHLLAGLRYFLMDLGGRRAASAHRSAWVVNLGGVALGLLVAAAWP